MCVADLMKHWALPEARSKASHGNLHTESSPTAHATELRFQLIQFNPRHKLHGAYKANETQSIKMESPSLPLTAKMDVIETSSFADSYFGS